MDERALATPRRVGVILRDAAGVFYVIAAERLAAFQVADGQRPLVEALVHGEDVVGFLGCADGDEELAALCRSLKDADGAWASSLHVTHVASSLWVLGR